ncbi:MAG: SRPBCC family protein, partial [Phenylobacterium sp.]|nr:SRPBCC family protein [Phenylobacterium sp.]
MHQATREIVVRAPPKRVWDTLTAFESYPDWTPAVRVKGDLEPGGKLDYAILVGRPGRRPRHFSLAGDIEQVEPLACLSWDVGLPSLLRMRFAIHFSRCLDATKVRQSVEISGFLAAVAGNHLAKVL